MAKKELKEKKEKPLEKMTAKELRELALSMPEITGVHGMNKAELIMAVKKARGITEEKKEKGTDVRTLKKQIAALKEERVKAHETEDKKRVEILRKKISRLKKKTRRAA